MATRVARVADLASSLIGIVGHGCVSKIRWVSSLSEASLKPNKKITDRLFGVIDAVNDRKLPSELRGQRNAVRDLKIEVKNVSSLNSNIEISNVTEDLA
ncbi:hypothetical protein LOK49_LG05G00674 [Camellia lanceoleosa]|uniref:Uncharacterized protein n=1 Tax=Camellia lanceoleosa TaxID=1840588 RepID=A0ACC0HNF7_9ERIC|nr:hypothetical protein LOK49_LG05G00674 [Camellia lanceoleosa]